MSCYVISCNVILPLPLTPTGVRGCRQATLRGIIFLVGSAPKSKFTKNHFSQLFSNALGKTSEIFVQTKIIKNTQKNPNRK